jgi:hypothetical protein
LQGRPLGAVLARQCMGPARGGAPCPHPKATIAPRGPRHWDRAEALIDLARKRSCIRPRESAAASPAHAVAAPGGENIAQSPSPARAARLRLTTMHSRTPERNCIDSRQATAPPRSATLPAGGPPHPERLRSRPSLLPLPEQDGTRRPFTARHRRALSQARSPVPAPSRPHAPLIGNGRFRANFLRRGHAKSRFPRPP